MHKSECRNTKNMENQGNITALKVLNSSMTTSKNTEIVSIPKNSKM
jgi:hypothetical protein